MIGWIFCFILVASSVEGRPKRFHPRRSNVQSPYIIGGADVPSKSRYPWMLSLQKIDQLDWIPWCGAVLFRSNKVLTAARCVYTEPAPDPLLYRVLAGARTVWEGDFHDGEQIVFISAISVHPEYVGSDELSPNDLAVLTTAANLDTSVSANVQLAILAKPEDGTLDGYETWIAGWGMTSQSSPDKSMILQHVRIPLVGSLPCRNEMQRYGSLYGDKITVNHYCVYDANNDIGPCQGDQGGPSNTFSEGVWRVSGIASWFIYQTGNNCRTDAPGVYTSVAAYIDWISNQ